VVIPAYNCGRRIGETLRSVAGQGGAEMEILVIDDGSTDATAAAVEAYAGGRGDARVRCIRNEVNQGVAAARNRGVAEARGEWIAFLDSDDIWMPGKLDAQLRLCLERNPPLCYTGAAFIDHGGRPTGKTAGVPESVGYAQLLRGNVIIASTVVVRRDCLLRFPFERSDLHEDYIAWLRILRAYGDGIGIGRPLVQYRLTRGSKSRNKVRSAVMTWRTYRYMELPLPQAALCFLSYVRHGLRRYVL
jgi:teichuronic acid biosynthesis glycosyltransferase TuaG